MTPGFCRKQFALGTRLPDRLAAKSAGNDCFLERNEDDASTSVAYHALRFRGIASHAAVPQSHCKRLTAVPSARLDVT